MASLLVWPLPRWKYESDLAPIEMFKILHDLWDQYCVSIECFYDSDRVFSKDWDQVLNKLIEQIKWRNSRKEELLTRITKIAANKSFSVRDGKLLKKLVKSQSSKGEIDYKALQYYFPGKTVEMIAQEYSFLANLKNRC